MHMSDSKKGYGSLSEGFLRHIGQFVGVCFGGSVLFSQAEFFLD
jgi:hypothetical protein